MPKKLIISLTGRQGSGKTTMFYRLLENRDYIESQSQKVVYFDDVDLIYAKLSIVKKIYTRTISFMKNIYKNILIIIFCIKYAKHKLIYINSLSYLLYKHEYWQNLKNTDIILTDEFILHILFCSILENKKIKDKDIPKILNILSPILLSYNIQPIYISSSIWTHIDRTKKRKKNYYDRLPEEKKHLYIEKNGHLAKKIVRTYCMHNNKDYIALGGSHDLKENIKKVSSFIIKTIQSYHI